MISQAALRAFKTAVVALACGASVPGFAGPRVGSVIGASNSTTTTVNARVISSTPVVAKVETPRQVCFDEMRQEAPRSSGAGAIIGAIAGAAMGNALGRGSGRALTTGVGLIGGAVLGDHIETDGRVGRQRAVQRCEQQSSYENRVVAYDVVYEVGGQRYSTQTTTEPGRTLLVQLSVTPLVSSSAPLYGGNPVVYTREPEVTYSNDVVVVPSAAIETRYERPYRNGWHGHSRDWD